MPTLILIMAGTNDVWYRKDILSTLEHVAVDDVNMLQESFPEARIVLVTPMQNTRCQLIWCVRQLTCWRQCPYA